MRVNLLQFRRRIKEMAHVIRRAYILGLDSGRGRCCAVDGMPGSGFILIPEPAVGPVFLYQTFFGGPIDVIAIAGIFRKPIGDAVHVLEGLEIIDKVFDKPVLSGDRARPSIACVKPYTLGWPVLEVIGAFHNLHALLREPSFETVDGVDEVVLIAF